MTMTQLTPKVLADASVATESDVCQMQHRTMLVPASIQQRGGVASFST